MKKLLVVVIAVAGLFLAAAPAVNAEYIANFDADMEGWTGGNKYWGSTGGQDGGYFGAVRNYYGPYLLPDPESPLCTDLYGDVSANLGGNLVTYSFYLKDIGETGGLVDQFLVWGGGTILRYNHPDTTSPADWTLYTLEIDTAAGEAPENWTMDDPGVGWATAWSDVTYYNFWSSPGVSGDQDHGIDTVRVSAIPEPSIVVLLLGLAGLACLVRPARR